jgi:flavin-dependent dehydrogenase
MIIEGKDIQKDIVEWTDVCIVGSGAGGAVIAKELQEAGLQCIVLEEGGYYTHSSFTSKPLEMTQLLYREMGMTMALGMPTNRSISGNVTSTNAPSTGPHLLPAPPRITIESTRMDSMIVKLVGST